VTSLKLSLNMPEVVPKRKLVYREKLLSLLEEYTNVLVVQVDFVGSNQLQQIRSSLRGRAEILLGKNTVMRKVIREKVDENPSLEKLMNSIRGNVGLVFTNDDLKEIRDAIQANTVPAAAKTGVIAPSDVFIPPGPTSLDPGQTSFFQALNILTKINRGAIEIINKVHLIAKGDKVSASAVALLSKLNIRPFEYGVTTLYVYQNGSFYEASVLDLSDDDLLAKFFNGVNKAAALSLAVGIPTLASLPHSLANGFKKLLAISVMTDYTFEEAKSVKEFLENPEAFAVAAPVAAEAAAEEEPEEEEEEESSDEDMGFSLFD